MAGAPAAALMEELEEEVLLRFPPHEPALLVRATLVCRRWRHLVSGPAFRRRFRELHRTPPMLGFVCNIVEDDARTASFITSADFCSPDADLGRCRALDSRHGRVLLQRPGRSEDALVVWDPITDDRREFPLPPRFTTFMWTAAVLCAVAACDNLDCNRGPFLVVFLGSGSGEAFICTYSSDAGIWSDPIAMQHPHDYVNVMPSVLVGNALYFGLLATKVLLKYDLESQEMSLFGLPFTFYSWRHVAVDGDLGLTAVRGSKLCLWKWKKVGPEGNAGWTQNRVIELETLLPSKAISTSPFVVGYADGGGVIFLMSGLALYRIDMKTCKATKACMGRNIYSVVPYMRFYTPALGAASAEGSSLCTLGA